MESLSLPSSPPPHPHLFFCFGLLHFTLEPVLLMEVLCLLPPWFLHQQRYHTRAFQSYSRADCQMFIVVLGEYYFQ